MHQLCVCHFVVFLLLISLLTVNKQHLVSLSLSWLVGSILIFLGDWKMTFFFGTGRPWCHVPVEQGTGIPPKCDWKPMKRLCSLLLPLNDVSAIQGWAVTWNQNSCCWLERLQKMLNTLVCWSGNGQQNDSLHSGTRIWKIFAIYGCWIPKTLCQVWSLWTFSIIESIVHGEWLKQMS